MQGWITVAQWNRFVEISCYLAQLHFDIECCQHLSAQTWLFEAPSDAMRKCGLYFRLCDTLEDNHPQSPLSCGGNQMLFCFHSSLCSPAVQHSVRVLCFTELGMVPNGAGSWYGFTSMELQIPQGRAWYLIVHGFEGCKTQKCRFPLWRLKRWKKKKLNIQEQKLSRYSQIVCMYFSLDHSWDTLVFLISCHVWFCNSCSLSDASLLLWASLLTMLNKLPLPRMLRGV